MSDESVKENDEIELMDLFLILWRRKWLIVCFVCFSMLITIAFLTVQQNKELRSETQISLNFEGIDDGLYPDGSIFESKDIISPSVLSRLNLEVDLTNRIRIEGIIPAKIKAKSLKAPGFVYHPNKFKIILTDENASLFPSSDERADVLINIVEMFRAIFKEKFIDEPVIVFDLQDDFIKINEYDDIVKFFRTRINLLQEVLGLKEKESGLFQSTESSYSFSQLLNELDILKTVDLRGIASKIVNFHFVKDKTSFSVKIKNDIKNIEYDRLKHEKMAEASFELLKTVMISSEKSIVKTPSSGTQIMLDSSGLEQIKADDYVNYLIKFNLEAKNSATNNSIEIAKLKDRIKGLENNEKFSDINSEEIVRDLKIIQKKINQLVQKANTLNKEYLGLKHGNMVRIVNPPVEIIKYKYKTRLIILLSFVGSFLFSIFLALFVDYIIRYRKISQPSS